MLSAILLLSGPAVFLSSSSHLITYLPLFLFPSFGYYSIMSLVHVSLLFLIVCHFSYLILLTMLFNFVLFFILVIISGDILVCYE